MPAAEQMLNGCDAGGEHCEVVHSVSGRGSSDVFGTSSLEEIKRIPGSPSSRLQANTANKLSEPAAMTITPIRCETVSDPEAALTDSNTKAPPSPQTPPQLQQQPQSRYLTILVAGASNLGKTRFISNLTTLYGSRQVSSRQPSSSGMSPGASQNSPPSRTLSRTTTLERHTAQLLTRLAPLPLPSPAPAADTAASAGGGGGGGADEAGANCGGGGGIRLLHVSLLDAPGYDGEPNKVLHLIQLVEYLLRQRERDYRAGAAAAAAAAAAAGGGDSSQQQPQQPACRGALCLYFLPPADSVAPIDLAYMSALAREVPLLPVLALGASRPLQLRTQLQLSRQQQQPEAGEAAVTTGEEQRQLIARLRAAVLAALRGHKRHGKPAPVPILGLSGGPASSREEDTACPAVLVLGSEAEEDVVGEEGDEAAGRYSADALLRELLQQWVEPALKSSEERFMDFSATYEMYGQDLMALLAERMYDMEPELRQASQQDVKRTAPVAEDTEAEVAAAETEAAEAGSPQPAAPALVLPTNTEAQPQPPSTPPRAYDTAGNAGGLAAATAAAATAVADAEAAAEEPAAPVAAEMTAEVTATEEEEAAAEAAVEMAEEAAEVKAATAAEEAEIMESEAGRVVAAIEAIVEQLTKEVDAAEAAAAAVPAWTGDQKAQKAGAGAWTSSFESEIEPAPESESESEAEPEPESEEDEAGCLAAEADAEEEKEKEEEPVPAVADQGEASSSELVIRSVVQRIFAAVLIPAAATAAAPPACPVASAAAASRAAEIAAVRSTGSSSSSSSTPETVSNDDMVVRILLRRALAAAVQSGMASEGDKQLQPQQPEPLELQASSASAAPTQPTLPQPPPSTAALVSAVAAAAVAAAVESSQQRLRSWQTRGSQLLARLGPAARARRAEVMQLLRTVTPSSRPLAASPAPCAIEADGDGGDISADIGSSSGSTGISGIGEMASPSAPCRRSTGGVAWLGFAGLAASMFVASTMSHRQG
ncbi:hypothetical protein Agub_g4627 [Astrephomene gubernaculifera]|uniref:Septin-type G domain-containing protein n=1 Tax=Astrephomene gubernaculifera TaxID=47775 RepID=A0AAD3DPF2_9CHLO|nr:hypothetical protein Agub_g4627 [Astrephomene gubernaculifera]